jgi:hypothetical protein
MVDQESVRPLAKSAAAKAKHTPAPGYEKVARAMQTGFEPKHALYMHRFSRRKTRAKLRLVSEFVFPFAL